MKTIYINAILYKKKKKGKEKGSPFDIYVDICIH